MCFSRKSSICSKKKKSPKSCEDFSYGSDSYILGGRDGSAPKSACFCKGLWFVSPHGILETSMTPVLGNCCSSVFSVETRLKCVSRTRVQAKQSFL